MRNASHKKTQNTAKDHNKSLYHVSHLASCRWFSTLWPNSACDNESAKNMLRKEAQRQEKKSPTKVVNDSICANTIISWTLDMIIYDILNSRWNCTAPHRQKQKRANEPLSGRWGIIASGHSAHGRQKEKRVEFAQSSLCHYVCIYYLIFVALPNSQLLGMDQRATGPSKVKRS